MDLDQNGGAPAPADDDVRPASEAADATTTPATPADPDDAELAEALRLAEEEEKGGVESEPQLAAKPPQPVAGTEVRAKTPGPVPYERFAEVNAAARAAREEAAYLKGQLDALKATGQQAAPTAAPEPAAPQDPLARIKALRAEIEEAAEQFDEGQISLRDFEKKRAAAEDEIAELNLRRLAPPPSASLADEALLATHAATLDQQYPYLTALEVSQLRVLQAMAEAKAAAEGRPYGTGPRELMRLREDVARLTQIHGPEMAPHFRPPTRPQSNTRTGTPPGTPLSPAAQARLRKMEVAYGMPPDTSTMGSAGNEDGYSDARINAMTDDEIAALPASVRARILNR